MSRVVVNEFLTLDGELHPLVLGGGRRLFPDGTMKTPLRLVDSTTTTKGVLILTYEPAETDAEG